MCTTAKVLGIGAGVICAVFAVARVRADAPIGRYEVDIDTIYDTKTKLTWQRVHAPGTMTQTNGIAYCLGLNINGLGWRLPTVKELSSLVDLSIAAPNSSIDPAFTGTPYFLFWSASPVAGPPDQAWVVDFRGGYVGIDFPAVGSYHVRCVR
jgi:hypothetical protein